MSYNEMSPADIKAVLGNGNAGNYGMDCGFGFGGAWWILILLAMGWGGMGGYGGMNMMWPWMLMANGGFGGNNSTDAYVQRGFDQAAVTGAINNVNTAVNALSPQLCNGFAGVTAAVSNGFANAETAANARQIANMQQGFNTQTAIDGRLDTLAMGQQQGICENRAAIADVKYTLANEGCQTRFAAANNTRDIIDAIGTKVQGLHDKLCQLELDGVKQNYENRIAGMQTAYNAVVADNQNLRYTNAVTAQNALIQQGFTNEIDALYNRLNNCPVATVPVYGRQPIFSCGQNQRYPQNNQGCPMCGYAAA